MNQIIYVDGSPLAVRAIERTDVEELARMFRRLSRESVYFRFFSPLPQVPDSTVLWLADVDHGRREALVALHGAEIVAIASYDELPQPGPQEAEIALTVDNAWQHRGVGTRLARDLAALAVARGYDALIARALPDNRAALALIRKLAPEATLKFAGGDYAARLPLRAARAAVIDASPQPGNARPSARPAPRRRPRTEPHRRSTAKTQSQNRDADV